MSAASLSSSLSKPKYDPTEEEQLGPQNERVPTTELSVKHDNGPSSASTDCTAIARRGHGDARITHSSFDSLVPLRRQANAGELHLERPSAETVQATKERTEVALGALDPAQYAAHRPNAIQGRSKDETTFVRHKAGAHGKTTILKIQKRQVDPVEPPKFKHKRIPGRAPPPPPPILHSPPHKLTAEMQELWKIPPSVSNWKNPKGYSVPFDKRLECDGREWQDVSINGNFGMFSEALQAAEQHTPKEVNQRALMQQRIKEKEKLQQEDRCREHARQAREERANYTRRRSGTFSPSSDSEQEEEEEAIRRRSEARNERKQEFQRELRQTKLGTKEKL